LKSKDEFEYLKNFKTVEYLMSGSYSELLESLLKKNFDYDVSVVGHSLGLCDKTLLNEILDNKRCKNISLHKRSDLQDPYDDFKELTTNLSRIINHEGSLREKVIPFSRSNFFPTVEIDDVESTE
jgi:hypothetical protein